MYCRVDFIVCSISCSGTWYVPAKLEGSSFIGMAGLGKCIWKTSWLLRIVYSVSHTWYVPVNVKAHQSSL
jgi:hypothetical protein